MSVDGIALTPEVLRGQLRAMVLDGSVDADCLDLYQRIFGIQYEVEARLRADDLYAPVSATEIERRIGLGVPAIDIALLKFGEADLALLLHAVCSAISRTGSPSPMEDRLLDALSSAKLSLSGFVRKVIEQGIDYCIELSRVTGLDKDVIAFAGRCMIAPFVRVCARSMSREANLEAATGEACPVCGSPPLMAKLRREDGKRVLECSLCLSEWTFPRLSCPHCGNADRKTLGFFFVDTARDVRVDKCDSCRTYIKTVDQRKRSEDKCRALAVEDLATTYMDILAHRQGYSSIAESSWKETEVNDQQ